MQKRWFLLRQMVRQDFRGRYAGSVLGFLWSFIHPLWLLVLFTFVFSTVMKTSLLGARTERFSVFLFAGLLPWLAVHEGVLRASTAITDHANLVKKLRFPTEILVLAVVVVALFHEGIAALAFVGVLAWVRELSWGGLPLLLVAVPLQAALTLGLGLLVASLHVFFRDTAQVLGMVFTAWFYLTPVVYPLALVPERYRGWLELNPLTPLVELYRQAFLGGEVQWVPGTGRLLVVAAVLLCVGAWLFGRLKPAFVDEI